ncbi:hypothetical protein SJDPG4_00555 [Porphyromonas gingivalis SJD4]|nr:hypothetical protein SJDPG4_00555 [Porphyromonas gingivalis SJD4]
MDLEGEGIVRWPKRERKKTIHISELIFPAENDHFFYCCPVKNEYSSKRTVMKGFM